MYLTMSLKQFNEEFIILSDKIKNNIMNNSDFYRIYYSTPNITFNGIFLDFELENINIEQYFNKIKCCFTYNENNMNIIGNILEIEKNILKKSNIFNKSPVYRIEEQLQNNFIKIFDDKCTKIGHYKNKKFFLKISGIWANSSNEYGLTFRFFIY